MCVAAVIFKPVPLRDLINMEESNPHGAGIAWEQEGQIYFVKGLSAREIHEMQTAGAMSYPYLLHFRWATHGDKVPQLTHPFVIGPRALMGEVTGTADRVLIHNGTWSMYDRAAVGHMNDGNYELPEELVDSGSDTAVAAWLASIDEGVLDSVQWATALAEMRETTNEAGEPCKTMDITTRGEWYSKNDNWYSNLHWDNNNSWEHTWSYFKPKKSFDYDGAGDPEWMKKPDDDPHWDTCIAPSGGWISVVGWVDPDTRKDDKFYVGRTNNICVSEKFYDFWFPEKDHYRPDNVDVAAWYERFDWVKTADNEMAQKAKEERVAAIKEAAKARQATVDGKTAPFCNGAMGSAGISWRDYLVAKYGDEVAGEIYNCFQSEAEAAGPGEEGENYEALRPDDASDLDPDWMNDGDLVTDNPSVVNAYIGRMMER